MYHAQAVLEWAMAPPGKFALGPGVKDAIQQGHPVVALESSVIAQGLPRPQNLEAALAIEGAVRDAGAVPATVAILDGWIRVGLLPADLERLATEGGIEKAGTRDIGWAVTTGATMATTVASSMVIAHAAGIQVLATGGIGGVHRGAATTGDISHDLHVLSRVPMVTICSGIKSILDLSRTLEYLETVGVPVMGYQTQVMPDFYCVDSGFRVPHVPDAKTAGRIYSAQLDLGLASGLVLVNPPPSELAFARSELDGLVTSALGAAEAGNVRGKAVTPYLLDHIAKHSGGRSVRLNIALLVSNARLAGLIAGCVASL